MDAASIRPSKKTDYSFKIDFQIFLDFCNDHRLIVGGSIEVYLQLLSIA